MSSSHTWFEVDKEGLAAIVQRRGLSFVIYELLQNAWDEKVTRVDATLEWSDRTATVTVEDDAPEGFTDLADTFTLFAPSKKKSDPTRRGRFNLGEKLILSVCKTARIETTTGTVVFDKNGRHVLRSKREQGSRFIGVIPMTKAQFDQVCDDAVRVIPPTGIETTFNGVRLAPPIQVGSVDGTLTTELSNEEGLLSRCRRMTKVELYEPRPGETASLYELGIPICETGDRWHYNVMQKVPLTLDRENVPDSFLGDVRLLAFNEKYIDLTEDDANREWVEISAANQRALPEAVRRYMDLRFGSRRVAYDPSDPEANKIAMAQGYTVVRGGMMNAGAWSNAKQADAIQPAGQVTPSSKVWSGEGKENATPFDDWITDTKWSPGMRLIADYSRTLAKHVMGVEITVKFCASAHHLVGASYGCRELVFNKFRLGNDWFEHGITEAVDALLIHEFGHEFASDHLSEEYYEALCKLGARMKRLALEKPELFAPFVTNAQGPGLAS
jgi:hypothetical protein